MWPERLQLPVLESKALQDRTSCEELISLLPSPCEALWARVRDMDGEHCSGTELEGNQLRRIFFLSSLCNLAGARYFEFCSGVGRVKTGLVP